jgi:hypothetical protein
MQLPFGSTAEVKCRHCGSPDVRVSTRTSSSGNHITYRCHGCKRHFRVKTLGRLKHRVLIGGSFVVLVVATLVAFLYVYNKDNMDDVALVEYQPTLDMTDQAALEKTQQSAREGNPQAQFDLGMAHWQRGEYLQAFQWLKAAAGQGHREAEYKLGMAYLEGNGTEQNYRLAFEQFTHAAQQGNVEAQYRLGIFHRDGLATPANKETAYLWLNMAAARGQQDALHFRDKLTTTMTPEQIHRAQEASASLLANPVSRTGPSP